MREIKFRAWDKISNIMISNEEINQGFMTVQTLLNLPNNFISESGLFLPFLNTEYMQFTGLYDKNGVEIYEGDKCIVERPCVGAVGIIKFQQGCFSFVENYTKNILRLCDLKFNNYTIEVIGNIYNNPELLKEY